MNWTSIKPDEPSIKRMDRRQWKWGFCWLFPLFLLTFLIVSAESASANDPVVEVRKSSGGIEPAIEGSALQFWVYVDGIDSPKPGDPCSYDFDLNLMIEEKEGTSFYKDGFGFNKLGIYKPKEMGKNYNKPIKIKCYITLINVATNDDKIDEGNGWIMVTLLEGDDYEVGDNAAFKYRVNDNDDPPPVNSAPTASNGTVATDEDTRYTFSATDFNFMDTDSGDTLVSVKITSLETAGDLELDGMDITDDQDITKSDIDDSDFTFTPAANAYGNAYATFKFKVNDGHDR